MENQPTSPYTEPLNGSPRQVVLNGSYGNFMLSHEAVLHYAQLRGLTLYFGDDAYMIRHYYRVPEADYQALEARDPEAADAAYFADLLIDRDDPTLLQVVRELGDAAHLRSRPLHIVDVPPAPAGYAYEIDNYDGVESLSMVSLPTLP